MVGPLIDTQNKLLNHGSDLSISDLTISEFKILYRPAYSSDMNQINCALYIAQLQKLLEYTLSFS